MRSKILFFSAPLWPLKKISYKSQNEITQSVALVMHSDFTSFIWIYFLQALKAPKAPLFITFSYRPAVALFRSGRWAQTHSLHPPCSLGLRGEICSARFWHHLQERRDMSASSTKTPQMLKNKRWVFRITVAHHDFLWVVHVWWIVEC